MKSRIRWCALLAATAVAAAACTDEVTKPVAPTPPDAPALAAGQYGQLQYFGYVGGDTEALNGTDSYTNWGWFATDATPGSTAVTSRINQLWQRQGMKTVIDMGNLLWCGEGQRTLCPGWRDRLLTWWNANRTALASGKVLAISVRDEPFALRADIAQMDSASRMVDSLFPASTNLLLIDAAPYIADTSSTSWFNLYRSRLTVVNWIALDYYGIHPASDPVFQNAMARMKAQWPGRRVAYAADGWWAHNGLHRNAFGPDTTVMASIMREWYAVASADRDAIMIGIFIWDSIGEGQGSRNLPRAVTQEHLRLGRMVTGRARPQKSLPVGSFESLTPGGVASGWACDPDGAWSEAVLVDFWVDGAFAGTTTADIPSHDPMSPCRGRFYRFQHQLTRTGSNVSAVVKDLTSGSTTLCRTPGTASVAWVQPSGASWGPPNTLTAAGHTSGGCGGVQMWWRDVTVGGPYKRVDYAPLPSPDGTWSNTIPSDNYCHDYQVYVTYAGVNSPVFTWRGRTSGYCSEQARVIWVQPASTAGYGPPGSLVVAGEATGAPAGTPVALYWRNLTLGGAWVREAYEPTTDSNGIWLNSIPNANPLHRFEVFVRYDVVDSPYCTYTGTGSISWC
jgi:hypothetical protein